MDDCTESIGQAQVYTTPDAQGRYLQVPIKDGTKDKTTFISHHGSSCYICLLFGLRNALATFQCALETTLPEVQWKVRLVYLDAIVIFSKSPKRRRY